MRFIGFLLVSFLVASPSESQAEIWKSADGAFSIESPEAARFQAMAMPPTPFLVIWKSSDEETMLGIMKVDVPVDVALNQASMEEGLSVEVGATVRRLPSRQLAGHEVWSMSASAPIGEITQAILRHDTGVYKIMAVTQPNSPDIASVERFLNSLTILPSMKEVGTAEAKPSRGFDAYRIVGVIGVFVVLVIVVVASRRFIRKKPAAKS